MCDYSLHNVKTRPAKVGDKLITRQFHSGTTGFSAPEDASMAVCVLPGTELSFRDEVRRVRRCGPRTLSSTRPQSSDRSIKTTRQPITMRWNFQMAGSFC